jgi:hypothetical protein
MAQMIEVENIVTKDCRRVLHLMSNVEYAADVLASFGAPDDVQARITQEAGVWHLRAEWPFRGPLEIVAEGWPAPKTLLVWSLQGERVSVAIRDAAEAFHKWMGQTPRFAFVRSLPAKAERWQDVYDVMLLDAEWMMAECVAVGG